MNELDNGKRHTTGCRCGGEGWLGWLAGDLEGWSLGRLLVDWVRVHEHGVSVGMTAYDEVAHNLSLQFRTRRLRPIQPSLRSTRTRNSNSHPASYQT